MDYEVTNNAVELQNISNRIAERWVTLVNNLQSSYFNYSKIRFASLSLNDSYVNYILNKGLVKSSIYTEYEKQVNNLIEKTIVKSQGAYKDSCKFFSIFRQNLIYNVLSYFPKNRKGLFLKEQLINTRQLYDNVNAFSTHYEAE